MINPYIIILVLFIVTGLATTVWGLCIMARSRKTRHWPSVTGIIEYSAVDTNRDDLLPDIRYRYTIDGQTYHQQMTFSRDITPTQEYTQQYIDKYPANCQAQVFYDPARPEHSTLESDPGQGDWLVFAVGLAMAVVGIMLLIA